MSVCGYSDRLLSCRQREIHHQDRGVRVILQRQASMAYQDSAQPIIGSCGAVYCVNVAMYNEEAKIALIAHFDDKTDVAESIELLKSKLNIKGHDEVVVHMATRYPEDNELLEELRRACEKNMFSLEEIHRSSDLFIDARNGEISTDIQHRKKLVPQESKDLFGSEVILRWGVGQPPSCIHWIAETG